MDSQIKEILSDLYDLEPGLREHEQQLITIIRAIVASKPNPVIDQSFVKSLRDQLVPVTGHGFADIKVENNKINFMKKFNFALGGLMVCLLLVAGAVYYTKNGNGLKLAYDNNPKIIQAGENAFGKLSDVSEVNTQATGIGGGMGGSLATTSEIDNSRPQSGGGGGGVGIDKMIAPFPPYDYQTYRYVYKGEELDLSEAKREVLKRLKGDAVSVDLGNLLGSLNLGLVDLGKFSNLRLQSASFIQPGAKGYNIYVSVDESNISINGMWPQPLTMESDQSKLCIDGPGCGYNPVKLSEIPADEELISIANSFVAEYAIPVQAYGTPEVQNDWRIYYEAAQDKNNYYLPEVLNVVYPLMINGQFVYDEGGNKTGLNVGVNVRNKKVTSVWDLSLQNYQSSMYDSETDSARILKIAEKGGMYGYVDPNAKTVVDIELGTPKLEFVKMWNYKNFQSEELLIPSLIFPITNQPESSPNYYYRKSVVVPLIKEILDRDTNGGVMPLERSVSEPAAQ